MSVSQTVAAAPDAVWWALTAGRAAWWPELVFDPAAGSPLVETWTEDGEVRSATGEVVRCDAPGLLAFRWREPSWAHPLDVTIRLAAAGAGTEVTLTESGFATAGTPPTLPAEHAEGWRYHLQRLRRVSETGSAGPSPRA
ncbi:MAG: SRPBCC domain-containing protein [Micrococcales bacterium]|nr:SRPBCC domain-containing protein [Micrococcales bacterium]